jgi:hypothetical protein
VFAHPSNSAGALVSILAACCERRVGLQATVHTSAVFQRAHFIPQSLQSMDNWWFACDDFVGLHICIPYAQAKIVTQLNERGPRLLLYGHPAAHGPALVLESADERQADIWYELLQTIA